MLDAVISWIYGVDHAEVSTLDAVLYRDTGHNWPVKEGYGALVAAYGAGLPVRLSTPATAIDWRGPGVTVATPAGDLEARPPSSRCRPACWQKEQLRFSPALPAAKLTAIENLPLGVADKVVFRMTGDPFGMPADSYAHRPSRHKPHDQRRDPALRPRHRQLLFRRRLCPRAGGKRRARGRRRGRVVNLFGTTVRQHLSQPTATAWHLDPFARGAYSAARPGHAHRRADLAAPLGDRLFFAGEACSLDFFSTCHGAHLSGIDAALAAARVLAPGAAATSARGA